MFDTGLGYERVDLRGVDQRPLREFLVFLPAKLYFAPSPAARTVLPAGKFWMSAALTGSRAVGTRFAHLVGQVEGLNPQLLLDEIAWGAVAASFVGERVINHVPVSEYTVSVSLTRALSAASGPEARAMSVAIKEQLAALRSSPSARASSSVLITVWVDGPGHVAQMQAVVPGSGLGTVSTTLSNVGEKISISLPLPAQVVDITLLMPPGAPVPRSPWLDPGGR